MLEAIVNAIIIIVITSPVTFIIFASLQEMLERRRQYNSRLPKAVKKNESEVIIENVYEFSVHNKHLATNQTTNQKRDIIVYNFDWRPRLFYEKLEGQRWTPQRFLAWSPSGHYLVSGAGDGALRIWSAETGRILQTIIKREVSITSAAWSPDERFLALGSGNTACIHEVLTGRLVRTLEGHTGEVYSVAWSPNGHYIASASSVVQVHEARTGAILRTLEGCGNVAWSPDGRYLASCTTRATLIWEAATGQLLQTLPSLSIWVWYRDWEKVKRRKEARGSLLAWSPDGRFLASGGAVYQVGSWQVVRSMPGNLQWSPDGRYAVVGLCSIVLRSEDARFFEQTAILIREWEAATKELVQTLEGHAGEVNSVAWSPDGRLIASGSVDGTARVWDAATGQLVRALEGGRGEVWSVAWSPDGRYLTTGSRVWGAETGQLVRALDLEEVNSVAWSPNNGCIITGLGDGTLHIWDAAGGQLLRTLKGHTGYVLSAAWSPDERYFASGSSDGTVRVWDAAAGQLVRMLAAANSVAWSPNGRYLATGSTDNAVRVWDAGTGQLLRALEGHLGRVMSVAWSPDGRYLASGSEDRTIRVWNAGTGQLLRTMVGHWRDVNSLAWSPDGRRLASASWDATVRIWDVSE